MAAAAMVMRKTVKKKIAGEIPAIRLFPCLSGEGLTFIPDHPVSSQEISCWPPTTNSGILKVPVRGSVREILNYQNGRDIERTAYNSGPSTGWGLLIFKQFFLWWYVFQLLASSFQALFASQSPAQTVFSLQAKRIVINFHSYDVDLSGCLIFTDCWKTLICCVSLILALLDDVIKTFGAGNDSVFSEIKTRLFSI
jgi:hypothetical protein